MLFGKGQLHQGVIEVRERHSPSVLGNTHFVMTASPALAYVSVPLLLKGRDRAHGSATRLRRARRALVGHALRCDLNGVPTLFCGFGVHPSQLIDDAGNADRDGAG